MTGKDKFNAVGEKLKKEKEAKEETSEKAMAEVKNDLEKVRANPSMSQLYKDNAALGSENLAGQLPLLKVHTTNKSQGNELQDGSEPNNGWFFYKPTQEQFKEVECHILTISEGYRALRLNPKPGEKQDQFNQLLAGVVVNDGKIRPFMTFISGIKLSPMWEFGKELGKYTHNKKFPVPMFAIKVKLGTKLVSHSFGKSFAITFEVVKDENDYPVVVTDEEFFIFLRNQVGIYRELMNKIIEAKGIEEEPEPTNLETVGEEHIEKDRPITGSGTDNVPDEIPF